MKRLTFYMQLGYTLQKTLVLIGMGGQTFTHAAAVKCFSMIIMFGNMILSHSVLTTIIINVVLSFHIDHQKQFIIKSKCVTLRIFRTGDHLLWAEDRSIGVVREDSETSLQHSHGGEGVAATT